MWLCFFVLLYDVKADVLFLLSYLFSQYFAVQYMPNFAVQYMPNFKGKYVEDFCLWCKKHV